MIIAGLSCPSCGGHVIDNPQNTACHKCESAYPNNVLQLVEAHSGAKMRLVAKDIPAKVAVLQLAVASKLDSNVSALNKL
ncbi:MAG: hypothetical protein M0P64_02120 [Candidatus Pacebacteria bacterium]|jgi:hypothetical protein|nr:hypothetical protein [Candidatus Paceibacterota bacterium]